MVSGCDLMAEPKRSSEDPTGTNPLTTGGLCGSSLTTKELQQKWKQLKRRESPVRLLFEVPSSRVVQETLSKYVVYQVVVMRSGSFDSHRAWVERRYSDFLQFHHHLLEEFAEELEDVVLPRKLLTGNFSSENISERRLALQDYLAQLFSTRCIRHSPRFSRFFTEPELRKAHILIRSGQFTAALQQLQMVLEIQEKLEPWQKATLMVPTLSALAVCYRDLEEPERAFSSAHRALPAVRRYGMKPYQMALLNLLVDLGFQLGRPVAQLQDELIALRDAERGEVTFRSLKEVVIHDFL